MKEYDLKCCSEQIRAHSSDRFERIQSIRKKLQAIIKSKTSKSYSYAPMNGLMVTTADS